MQRNSGNASLRAQMGFVNQEGMQRSLDGIDTAGEYVKGAVLTAIDQTPIGIALALREAATGSDIEGNGVSRPLAGVRLLLSRFPGSRFSGSPVARVVNKADDIGDGGRALLKGRAFAKVPTRVRGQWQNVNEAMPARARAYQQQITGRGGQSYLVDGVKFDGVIDNVLIDAKGPGYTTFVRNGQFRSWFLGADDLVDQAQRQLRVANGNPIRWHVAEADAAQAMRNLFADRGITGIHIIHTPVVP